MSIIFHRPWPNRNMRYDILILLSLALSFTTSVSAKGYKYDESQIVGLGCYRATADITFDCEAGTSYLSCVCYSIPALGTFSNCVNEYAESSTNIPKAYEMVSRKCTTLNTTFSTSDYNQAYENSTKYLVNYLDSNFNASATNYSPVKFDSTTYNIYKRTFRVMYGQYDLSNYYGGAIMSYWCLVIVIATIMNFFRKLFPNLIRKFHGKFINTYRKWVTISEERTIRLWPLQKSINISVRGDQFLILVGYLIMLITLTCVSYEVFDGNTRYIGTTQQVSKILSDRSGIICFVHLPALFLFSGRNNILLWLTGWKYETFMVYHRWIGRGMGAEAFIHSVAYTVMMDVRNTYAAETKMNYLRYGIAAMVVTGILMFQSLRFFRQTGYEIFKIIHVIMVIMFILTCWYHCVKVGWMEYLYASIAFWAFDHFVRIIRLLWFGIFTKAEYKLYEKDDTFQIKMKRPPSWNPSPGSFVYLYILRPSWFYQSHPFTIIAPYNSDENNKSITIVIKIKNGLTKEVANYLLKQPNGSSTMYSLIEGPYGSRAPLDRYDTALLMCAGHGIPTGICNAENLGRRQVGNQRVVFTWVIRYFASFEWIYKDLEKLNNNKIETNIYITKGDEDHLGHVSFNDDSIDEKNDNDKKAAVVKGSDKDGSDSDSVDGSTDFWRTVGERFPFITLKRGRPDVETIIREEFKISAGSVGILTCGPDFFTNPIRDCVSRHLSECNGRVDLFEETQTW